MKLPRSFPDISRVSLETLQINIGYKCNQTCQHCHVNAGPNRWEMMANEILELIPNVISIHNIKVLDITGGAPELHPKFKYIVKKTREMGVEVIDRCNLTILQEPGFEDMASFLSTNKVQVVASMPCYLEENVDQQRGKGVFNKSIAALRELNKYGYGLPNSDLILNLVYNPQGPNLPPSQFSLEDSYRKELLAKYGIYFTRLFALTNMPINRFASFLQSQGKLSEYKELLYQNFNPKNLESIMCKNTLSLDWQGNLYDCDFNQQLGIKISGKVKNIYDLIKPSITLNNNSISVGEHCFGCTAGCGSSCGGELS